jgi:hypothetical protein
MAGSGAASLPAPIQDPSAPMNLSPEQQAATKGPV